MILHCNCQNPGQDALHGSSQRVHNKTKKQDSDRRFYFRCTVCEREKTAKDGRVRS